MSPRTYDQPTSAPTAKVAAVGGAGAIIALVVTALAYFGVIVPDGLSQQATAAVAAIITIITFAQAILQFAAGYIKKSEVKPKETV
jgi:uncharacterized membrane protein